MAEGELRTAWHHHEIPDDEFAECHHAAELDGNPGVTELAEKARTGTVTLLVATRDVARNHAHVLAQAIEAAE